MKLIHAEAECIECGWKTYSFNAMGSAARHHYKTGHEVHVEVGYAQIYHKGDRCKKVNCICKRK